MRIGFYIKWPKHSLSSSGNVLGDELYGESLCRALRAHPAVEEALLYAPNALPPRPVDIMVYLNDNAPQSGWARRHIAYLQNAYDESPDTILRRYQEHSYDGYVFFSRKLLDLHKAAGFTGLFLPFGVDPEVFAPRPPDPRYAFEVAYIGNDIKGAARTIRYILPAARYRFGLYGHWTVSTPRLRVWRRWTEPRYRRILASIARGKIPQADVATLYSTTKINLNCTAQACVDWDVVTLRTYEVLACQGFLISDRVPAAETDLADAMIFSDGNEDLVEKLDYYLRNEAHRRKIAKRGRECVLDRYTIDRCATTLLDYLGSLL